MKRFLLWIISVALGVALLLAAVMGVSYAFTTQGGCPDAAAQFGGQELETNGFCWQVPLLGGRLDKVFASPATLTVQKLGTLYTAHPDITLPDWARYTTLTIQTAVGSVVFAGSVSEYQSFLFPANGVVVLARNLALTGNTVVIDHGAGMRSYLYGLQALAVSEGQTVEKGQAVGALGEELTMDFKLGSKSVNPWLLFQTSGGLFWKENG